MFEKIRLIFCIIKYFQIKFDLKRQKLQKNGKKVKKRLK